MNRTVKPLRQTGSDGSTPNQGVRMAQGLSPSEHISLRTEFEKVLLGGGGHRHVTRSPLLLAMATPKEKSSLIDNLLSMPPSTSRSLSMFQILASSTSREEWNRLQESSNMGSILQWATGLDWEEELRFLRHGWFLSSEKEAISEMQAGDDLSRESKLSTEFALQRRQRVMDLHEEPVLPMMLAALEEKSLSSNTPVLDWHGSCLEIAILFDNPGISKESLKKELEHMRLELGLNEDVFRELFVYRIKDIYARSAVAISSRAQVRLRQLEQELLDSIDVNSSSLLQEEKVLEIRLLKNILQLEVSHLVSRADLSGTLYPTALTVREELAELLSYLGVVLIGLQGIWGPTKAMQGPLNKTLRIWGGSLQILSRAIDGDHLGLQKQLQQWKQAGWDIFHSTLHQATRTGNQLFRSARGWFRSPKWTAHIGFTLGKWNERGQRLMSMLQRTREVASLASIVHELWKGRHESDGKLKNSGLQTLTQHVQKMVVELVDEITDVLELNWFHEDPGKSSAPAPHQTVQQGEPFLERTLDTLRGKLEPHREPILARLDATILRCTELISREFSPGSLGTRSLTQRSLSLINDLHGLRGLLEERIQRYGSWEAYMNALLSK